MAHVLLHPGARVAAGLKSALPSLLLAAAREREVNSRGTARPASPNKTEPAPPGDVLRNPPRAGEIELEGKKEL